MIAWKSMENLIVTPDGRLVPIDIYSFKNLPMIRIYVCPPLDLTPCTIDTPIDLNILEDLYEYMCPVPHEGYMCYAYRYHSTLGDRKGD